MNLRDEVKTNAVGIVRRRAGERIALARSIVWPRSQSNENIFNALKAPTMADWLDVGRQFVDLSCEGSFPSSLQVQIRQSVQLVSPAVKYWNEVCRIQGFLSLEFATEKNDLERLNPATWQ